MSLGQMYEEKVFSEFGFKNIPLNFGDILTKSEKIKTPALKKLFLGRSLSYAVIEELPYQWRGMN